MSRSLLAKLNESQRAAVETLRGPLLVLAGAGTGKTRVVTVRIANLIAHGTRPERILAVTFTNKAAREMQERVGELLGRRPKGGARPQISTFHSHCVRVLRRHITRLGYPERFAICDAGDQESVARTVLREIRVPGELMRPGDLLGCISRWKSAGVRPSAAAAEARTDKEHLAAMAYRRYQRSLRAAGTVDFDDLLLLTEELFTEHREVRTAEASLFDHLLIDEYQDTNGSQYRIVRALASEHRNLCVVGDDDQSIYSWRGAEVRHILGFQRDWPEARVVRLEQNYRSTGAILEMANRLIAYNKLRHDKELRPATPGGEKPKIQQYANEEEEARGVVSDILRWCEVGGAQPRDIAILFRTNEQPRAFEQELRRRKVPYVLIGGRSFFDRKEVRDLLAWLRVLVHPEEETSLRRILNTPPRGITPGTVETLTRLAVEQGRPLWPVLCEEAAVALLKPNAREAVRRFVQLARGFQHRVAAGAKLAETARGLLDSIEYHAYLGRQHDDPNDVQSRWSALEEVVNALAAYERQAERPELGEFLDDLLLGEREFENDKEKELRRNAVALMTLHSAKGLEFPHVYLVGLEEGILPHHRSVEAEGDAIDEERRLCYVGVTRARERLTLTLALTRMKWGKPRDTHPSRFLFELIGQADRAAAAAERRPAGRSGAGGNAGRTPGKSPGKRRPPSRPSR